MIMIMVMIIIIIIIIMSSQVKSSQNMFIAVVTSYMYSNINAGSKTKAAQDKDITILITTQLFPSGGHCWDHQATVDWHPITPAKDSAVHPGTEHQ